MSEARSLLTSGRSCLPTSCGGRLQRFRCLLLISIILFVILNNTPGGPLAPYLQNPHITPADIERLKHNLGLDKPIWFQYFVWLGTILHGDFGYSTSNSEPVLQAICERLPATLELMGVAFVVSLVHRACRRHLLGRASVFVRRLLRSRRSRSSDSRCRSSGLRLMMQLAFARCTAFRCRAGTRFSLPSAGISTTDTFDLGDRIEHLIMPVIVLSLLNLALYQPLHAFVAARSARRPTTCAPRRQKGLSGATILFKHGLKNALIPVVTDRRALAARACLAVRSLPRRSSRGRARGACSTTRCSRATSR